MSTNVIVLSGNLVTDPEIKNVNGTQLANIRLASTRKYTTKNGDKGESSVFIDAEIWGGLAIAAEKILKKGDPITIHGRLEQQNWEKDGEKRHRHTIRVENFDKHYGRKNADDSNQEDDNQSLEAVVTTASGEDIPF